MVGKADGRKMGETFGSVRLDWICMDLARIKRHDCGSDW